MLEALRQRESGLTAEEMVAWAEEARYFVQTLFMVTTSMPFIVVAAFPLRSLLQAPSLT